MPIGFIFCWVVQLVGIKTTDKEFVFIRKQNPLRAKFKVQGTGVMSRVEIGYCRIKNSL